MRKSLLLPIILAAAVVATAAARAGEPRPEQHVVIISIDALRPEFYRSDAYDTPTLKALAASGASADGVQPAYPSLTYPGHASIVTGVRPDRHGITSNTVWGENGARPEWLWESSALKAKPIWKAAQEQGRKVAITQWPTTVGAEVSWLVPERWGLGGESTRDLLLKHSTPGLLFEIALELGIAKIDSSTLTDGAKIDEFVSGAAAYVLKTRKPDLLLVHLTQVDHFAHGHGRDAPEVKAAVARVDADVARIKKAAADAGILDHTVFVIVGDHGFTDVRETIAPNITLVKAGLVDLDAKGEVTSWRALGHAYGGSMGIRAKTDAAARAARTALEEGAVVDGKRFYRIVERQELDTLGAGPEAAFFLEAAEEKDIGGAVSGRLTTAHGLQGTHGGLPTRPQLFTGFIASGPGVRHATIAKMRLIDIAPTLARLMGVDMPDVDGGVLDILAVEPD